MQGACNLAIGVVGFGQTDFRIIIYSQTHEYLEKGKRDINTATLGVTGDDMMVCNKGCDWRALGDGHCNPQCNNTACFWDRLDCEHDDGSCPADCHPDWIGDGYCDEACFNAKCQWDKRDCLKPHEKPCGDGCMPLLLNDHECDAMCNVESCDFDRGDCFHDNTECYKRSDGADYRGTVRTTTGGVRCQKWSDQTPQVVLDPAPDPDPASRPQPQPSPALAPEPQPQPYPRRTRSRTPLTRVRGWAATTTAATPTARSGRTATQWMRTCAGTTATYPRSAPYRATRRRRRRRNRPTRATHRRPHRRRRQSARRSRQRGSPYSSRARYSACVRWWC